MRWVGGRGALRALPAPAHTGTATQWPYERSAEPRHVERGHWVNAYADSERHWERFGGQITP